MRRRLSCAQRAELAFLDSRVYLEPYRTRYSTECWYWLLMLEFYRQR